MGSGGIHVEFAPFDHFISISQSIRDILDRWYERIKTELEKGQHKNHSDIYSAKCSFADIHEMKATVEYANFNCECDACTSPADCYGQSQSDGKCALFETFMFLHLLETFGQWPSEETAKPLTQVFNHKKSGFKEFFTLEKIENYLDSLRTFLIN